MNRITLAPTTLPDTPPLEFIQAAVERGLRRPRLSPAQVAGLPQLGRLARRRRPQARGQTRARRLRPGDGRVAQLLPAARTGPGRVKPVARIRRRAGRDLRAGHWPRSRLVAPARHLRSILRRRRRIRPDRRHRGAGRHPEPHREGVSGHRRDRAARTPSCASIRPRLLRAGDTADVLRGRDPALLPYTQINDGKREGGGAHSAR